MRGRAALLRKNAIYEARENLQIYPLEPRLFECDSVAHRVERKSQPKLPAHNYISCHDIPIPPRLNALLAWCEKCTVIDKSKHWESLT